MNRLSNKMWLVMIGIVVAIIVAFTTIVRTDAQVPGKVGMIPHVKSSSNKLHSGIITQLIKRISF